MINGQTILAVIPARGGSKRCPRKNIKDFRGKPLIAWAIDEALKSKYIDKLFVSTEDEEIASEARMHDANVIWRPEVLATDQATNEDVLRHALELHPADWVVLLQPTSPLRTVEDIDTCIERAQMGEACVSYRRDRSKNGAVYVACLDWIYKNDFSNNATMRYVMPDERSLDIDYPEDFQ